MKGDSRAGLLVYREIECAHRKMLSSFTFPSDLESETTKWLTANGRRKFGMFADKKISITAEW